jgi:hypothetical protein
VIVPLVAEHDGSEAPRSNDAPPGSGAVAVYPPAASSGPVFCTLTAKSALVLKPATSEDGDAKTDTPRSAEEDTESASVDEPGEWRLADHSERRLGTAS